MSSSLHHLTVPLTTNDLFKFKSAPGYSNFLQCASFYPIVPITFATPAIIPPPFSDPYCWPVCKTRECSSCTCHSISQTALPNIIPPDSPSISASSPDKTREVLSDKTREVSPDQRREVSSNDLNKTREALRDKTKELDQLLDELDAPKTKGMVEPQAISFQDSDSSPIKSKPIDSDFCTSQCNSTPI